MRRDRAADLACLALLVAAVVLVFFDVLFLGRTPWLRDLIRTHYPERAILHAAFRSGELPLWNPRFGDGQPLAANPGYEVLYPPQWLVALPNLHLAFRLEIVLHYFIAAIGMYLFCRALRLRPAAALFGAVSFTFGGMLIACSNLLPYLFPLAWWPWIGFASARAFRARAIGDIALAALFLGLVLLVADPSIILESGALLVSWAAVVAMKQRRIAAVVVAVAIIGGSILIGAGQMIPALDLKRDSGRAEALSLETASVWSMPPVRAFELFFPHIVADFRSDLITVWSDRLYTERLPWIFSLYPGLLVGVLSVTGLIHRLRGSLFTAIVLVVAWLFAIGSHAPFYRLLHAATGGIVRYPEKYFIGAVFVVTLFAAMVAEEVLNDDRRRRTAAIVALVLAVAAAVATLSRGDAIWRNAWWPSVALAATLAAIFVSPARLRLPLLALFVVADLGPQIPNLMPTIDASFFTPPPLARALAASGRPVRIYNDGDVTLTPAGVRAGLTLTTYPWVVRGALLPETQAIWGFSAIAEQDIARLYLQPARTFHDIVQIVRAAGRADRLPLLMTMSGATHAIFLQRNFTPRVIAFSNERCWFADEVEQVRDPRTIVQFLLSNATFSPHFAFIDDPMLFHPAPGRVLRIDERWNSFDADVEAAGPAILVLCITPHRYWQATVDGLPADLMGANVGFQALHIPPGRHHVAMRYRNPVVIGSATFSGISALLLLAAAVALRSRGPRPPLPH